MGRSTNVRLTSLSVIWPAYPLEQLRVIGFSNTLIKTLGDLEVLAKCQYTALFCSLWCPGELILKTYDLARGVREAGTPVIGGFHTAMEKECLRLWLRGTQPIIICPARGIQTMRVPEDWRTPLSESRHLILSPFNETQRRPTAELSARRNELVAAVLFA